MRGFPAGFRHILGETQFLLPRAVTAGYLPAQACTGHNTGPAGAVGPREQSKELNPAPAPTPTSAFLLHPPSKITAALLLLGSASSIPPGAAEGVNPLRAKPDEKMFAVK